LADPPQLLTVGSGAIETQTMNAASVLPQSSVVVAPSSSNSTASASTVSGTALSAAKSAALAQRALPTFPSSLLLGLMILLGAFFWA
jgi:precorrin-2 methylase